VKKQRSAVITFPAFLIPLCTTLDEFSTGSIEVVIVDYVLFFLCRISVTVLISISNFFCHVSVNDARVITSEYRQNIDTLVHEAQSG
jgi:hypothetical protein